MAVCIALDKSASALRELRNLLCVAVVNSINTATCVEGIVTANRIMISMPID